MKTKLEILQKVANGELSPQDAEAELLVLSFVSGNEGQKLNLPPIKRRKKPEVALIAFLKWYRKQILAKGCNEEAVVEMYIKASNDR